MTRDIIKVLPTDLFGTNYPYAWTEMSGWNSAPIPFEWSGLSKYGAYRRLL